MSVERKEWEIRNEGKALRDFTAANAGEGKEKRSGANKGSGMVKRSKLALDDGPKAPAPMRDAVKRRTFDRKWREERGNAGKSGSRPVRAWKDFENTTKGRGFSI